MSEGDEEKSHNQAAHEIAEQTSSHPENVEHEKPVNDEVSDSETDSGEKKRTPNDSKANKLLGRGADESYDIEKQGQEDVVDQVNSGAGYNGVVNSKGDSSSGLPKGCEEKDGIILVGWAGEDDPEYPYNWTTKKKWTNGGLLSFMTLITYGFPLLFDRHGS